MLARADLPDRLDESLGRLEALLGLLLEEPHEEVRERLGEDRVHRARLARDLADVRREQVARGESLEGRNAAGHVVEGGAEGVEVAPYVEVLVSARELGRDVERRPERLPGARDVALLVQPLREPEVGELGLARLGDQDVLGLYVPVEDPLLAVVRHGARDLLHEVEALGLGDVAVARDQVARRAAAHELHGEVEVVLALPHLEGPDEVRVLELREELRLLEEAGAVAVVAARARREDLERDLALEALLDRAEDRPHAPGAEALDEDVAVDRPAVALDPEDRAGLVPRHVTLVDEERAELPVGLGGVAALGLVAERRVELLSSDQVLEKCKLTKG